MTLTPTIKKTIIECCCFLLILVFAYTGCSKLWDHHNFIAQLSLFIPRPLIVNSIAWTVPVAEIIIAFGLALRATRLTALYACLFLLSIFTTYIIFLLSGRQSLPCSCGGVIAALSWKQHLVFNSILIMLCIAGIRLQETFIKYKTRTA